MTTNVPAVVFTPTGVSIPDEGDVLNGVLADMNVALGGGMSTALVSPQGQLSQSFTAIVGDKNDSILEVVNAVNPDTAFGRYQDAIGRIYYFERIDASGTVVVATCSGQIGATIPSGSLAQDSAGYIYASLGDAVIGSTGSMDVTFQCTQTGPIACSAGSLNKIYKAVIGWETVLNAAAGTPGTDVESRDDFEYRRRRSVALNALNTVQAIRAQVLSVSNVLDAYVLDNPLATAVNTGPTNYPVAAHSIYVAAVGGSQADVAKAIWSKKPPGCDYNTAAGQGTPVAQVVQDKQSDSTPYPSYTVRWINPGALNIFFQVSLVASANLPSDILNQVRAAIVAAFNGTDGGSRARIGSGLYAGRYYAGVQAIDPSVAILSIAIGTSAAPTGSSVLVGIDQRPVLDPNNILVSTV